jgi:hypothetical protein
MERYDFECDAEHHTAPDGVWVKYEDAEKLLNALKMLRGQYVSFVRVTTGRDTEKDGNPYIAEVDAVLAEAERES